MTLEISKKEALNILKNGLVLNDGVMSECIRIAIDALEKDVEMERLRKWM